MTREMRITYDGAAITASSGREQTKRDQLKRMLD